MHFAWKVGGASPKANRVSLVQNVDHDPRLRDRVCSNVPHQLGPLGNPGLQQVKARLHFSDCLHGAFFANRTTIAYHDV